MNDPENFEVLPVRSLYDFMREVADIGYAGIWYFNNFPILFGNYLSDIDIELPSFAYTFDDDFIGATGVIEKPEDFCPWINYAKTDQVLRHYVNPYLGVPFDVREPVYTIVPKLTKVNQDGVNIDSAYYTLIAFAHGSPLQGSYVSDLGAYSVFTHADYAHHFLEQSASSSSGYDVVQLPSLLDFLNSAKRDFPFIDIGINPSFERYLQGYFLRSTDHWYVKTTHGIFKMAEDGQSFSQIPEPETLGIEIKDTIDQPNTFEPSRRGLRTTVKHPLKRVLGRTRATIPRREAQAYIRQLLQEEERGEFEEINCDGVTADSFLVFGFDKISGDSFCNHEEGIQPFVFQDVLQALSFFYHIHFPEEKKLRQNGYYYCPANRHVKGSNDEERELFILKEHRRALEDLMDEILVDGYKVEHAELLKSFINRASISLEIESCGYLPDIALFDEAMLSAYITRHEDSRMATSINSQAKKVRSKNSSLALDETVQNTLRKHLGASYRNLSTDTLCILESAVKQFARADQRLHHDFAGISMKLCKAFERELKRLVFDRWKNLTIESQGQEWLKRSLDKAKNDHDQTLVKLIGYALDRNKLELGPMRFVMRKLKTDQLDPVMTSLLRSIENLSNREFLLSEELVEACELIATKYRNGGVHEKIVSYSICKEAMERLLTDEDNYLKKLASV